MIKRRKGIAIVETPKGIIVVAGKKKKFTLPGGGANQGESRKDATIRELEEETTLKTKKIFYLFSYIGNAWINHRGKEIRNHVKVFLVDAYGKAKPSNEIKYLSYWNPKSKIDISNRTESVIKNYLKLKKRVKSLSN
ncbi:MAG: NUDIX domain-containing protein [Candidatus Pacearchaeota archaeon]|jgi:8-oxo-dGTP diphosphatase